MDAALAYRFTARTQLKLQYSLPHEDSGPRNIGHTIALQFTLRYSIVSPKLLSGFENLGAARKVTIPLR